MERPDSYALHHEARAARSRALGRVLVAFAEMALDLAARAAAMLRPHGERGLRLPIIGRNGM